MDIFSLYNTIKFNNSEGVYNLFEPTILYNITVNREPYIVTAEDEMRIDLIIKNMYQLEPNSVYRYLENVDVILRMNNIDNPLCIKEGMILSYPTKGDFEKFRYSPNLEETSDEITKQLGVVNKPNKVTKIDPNRQNYIENDYSLSPVILDTPREPVRIEDGRFSIGGL